MRRVSYLFSHFSGRAPIGGTHKTAALVLVLCALGAGALLPGSAAAEATPGPEPSVGPAGLPDGRLYEEVSPANKGAGEASTPPFVVSGVNGDEVAYTTFGTLSETPTGVTEWAIARRSSAGWVSRGGMPRAEGKKQDITGTTPQVGIGFSADVSETLFGTIETFVPEQEASSPTPHLYVYGEDGLVQWIGKPTAANPLVAAKYNEIEHYGLLAGASPDFGTIYFSFQGTLTPEDEEPNPGFGGLSRHQEIEEANQASKRFEGSNDGFYEWHEGALKEAGVLPNGHVNPYGAAAAATVNYWNYSGEETQNQVSEDGSKAFFVSPDPGAYRASCNESTCTSEPPQLYVREPGPAGKRSVLVSRDLLLPEAEGLPAGAPHGVVAAGNGVKGGSDYAYASPDGSRVFFQSTDRLTEVAPENTSVKAYEFDTETNTLTYLPGVADVSCPGTCISQAVTHIQTVSRDGSSFMFTREGEYELWHEGVVTEIGPTSAGSFSTRGTRVVRTTPNGSEYVFATNSTFEAFGFNNGNNGAYEQVYMYDVAANKLSLHLVSSNGRDANR